MRGGGERERAGTAIVTGRKARNLTVLERQNPSFLQGFSEAILRSKARGIREKRSFQVGDKGPVTPRIVPSCKP